MLPHLHRHSSQLVTYAILLDAVRRDDGGGRIARRQAGADAGERTPAPGAHISTLGTSDQAIAERIRGGDTDAFDEMVAVWWTPLWRFVRRDVESDAAAEDLVQDVFSWIWTHRERWVPTQSIRAYLYRMVRNQIIGERRHAHVVRVHTRREEATPHRDVAPPSAVEAVEQADLIARLEAALARLPARAREGVLLRYVHGLSHAEVAAVLGISIPATEKQIKRTLDKLRTWLAD